MPYYSFVCTICGTREDKHLSVKERNIVNLQCPSCKRKTLKRIYLPAYIIYKGGGFYNTDSKTIKQTDSE